MTRRDLIQKVIIGGTTFFILPPVLSSCSKEEDTNGTGNGGKKLTLDMTLAAYSALKTTGESLIVQGIIVANTSVGYIALNSVCTHQGCTVSYDSASNNLPCPCHGSIFATNGNVVQGPATEALKSYSITRSGDILTIKLE